MNHRVFSNEREFSDLQQSIPFLTSTSEPTNEYARNTFQETDRSAQFSFAEIDSPTQRVNKRSNVLVNKLEQQRTTIEQQISHLSISKSNNEIYRSTIEIPKRCRPDTHNTLREHVETLLPYYTLNELAEHNDSTDAWICIFSDIYDITSLIEKTRGTEVCQPLTDYAGQDVSFWFDDQTREPRRRIDPYRHVSVLVIESLSILEKFDKPFWQTKELIIGRLIEHPRYIRLMHNFAPKQSYLLEIDEDETIGQIAKKFLKYNSNAFSYVWQYDGKILDFYKTLIENGIPSKELFDEDCATIILYFSDMLTID